MNKYERYPNNIFKPIEVSDGNEYYNLFKASFSSVYDLYKYLKSDPEINKETFNSPASIDGDFKFAGVPYEEALENLVASDIKGYDEFLKLNSSFANAKEMPVNVYKTIMTQAGGHLNIPAYSAGNPLCYETEVKVLKPRFIRMYVTLSYSCDTSEKQIMNRAIIIASIVSSLEEFGYKVDLNTFSLDEEAIANEMTFINVKVKNYSQKVSMQSLYKVLCNVSFLRRILFRVLETLDVSSRWQYGYGSACKQDTIKKILKLNNNDIIITSPKDLGITGEDLLTDFNNTIEKLGLHDKISVDKARTLERK